MFVSERPRLLRPILIALLLVGALAPSAYLAWTWRAMPHLGIYNDDAIYLATAKSLAAGDGYRIGSFPGTPWQTKYPPLFPAALSLVWKINPNFPSNLPLAMLICWLALPAFMFASWLYFRNIGFSREKAAILCALLAVNPFVALYSLVAMSELPFATLLLLAVWLADRAGRTESPAWPAAVAGLAAAGAFLTKSAGLPLLVTAPACLLWRRQYRRAALFAATMTPLVFAWEVWKALHKLPGHDPVSLYYTNYLGFYFANVDLQSLPRFVSTNFAVMAGSLSQLLLPAVGDSWIVSALGHILVVFALMGIVRIVKRTGATQFPAYSAVFLLMLLHWHYPPTNRFLLPLAPVFLAGLAEELPRLADAVRATWSKPGWARKPQAAAAALMLVVLGAYWLQQAQRGLFQLVPGALSGQVEYARAQEPAYQWIRENTLSSARFFAYNDGLLYFRTGRRACSVRLPPRYFYRSDSEGLVKFIGSLATLFPRLGLDYAFVTPHDFQMGPMRAIKAGRRTLWEKCDVFRQRFQSAGARVYSIQPR